MFKHVLFKQLLKSKMKDVPQEHQEKILATLDKNPKLFQEIAVKAQEKMRSGKDQMTAVLEAAREHERELRNTLGGS